MRERPTHVSEDGHFDTFGDDFDDSPELCPMGCGRTTDDPLGGPCSECWKDARRGA